MAEEEAKPKRKSGLWIALILTVLSLSGVGVGAWYFVSEKDDQADIQPEFEPLEPSEMILSAIHPLNPFTVNLKDKKYLRFSLAVKFKNEKIPNIFYSKEYEIRDKIISLLNQKTSEQIVNPESRVILKNEIITVLKSIMNSDEVEDVYFVDLIVQ